MSPPGGNEVDMSVLPGKLAEINMGIMPRVTITHASLLEHFLTFACNLDDHLHITHIGNRTHHVIVEREV
jgi:hypothetical protein